MACRSFQCTGKPISTVVARACWTFDRCFGKTGGRSRVKISGKALTRSSRCAPVPRWNLRWREYRSAVREDAAVRVAEVRDAESPVRRARRAAADLVAAAGAEYSAAAAA